MSGLRIASVVTAVIAAALWGIAAILAGRSLAIDLAAAGTVTLSGVVFTVAYQVRDRDKNALVRAMAEVTIRRGQAPTQPLRQVS
jgi:hypothetical protein